MSAPPEGYPENRCWLAAGTRSVIEWRVCYISIMATTEDKLESLFAKVRALPRARQELAVEALSEIAEEETYKLSDEERAVLEPALERAKRGEFASDAAIDEVLNKPWS
jgi:hypothetical protein